MTLVPPADGALLPNLAASVPTPHGRINALVETGGALLPNLAASVPTPHGRINALVETGSDGVRRYCWSLPGGVRGFLRTESGDLPVDPEGTTALRRA